MMRALEAGADDFVSKSSDISILKARIRSLLRRKLQRDEHERISGHFRAQELEIVRERTEREAAERRAALADQLEVANQDRKGDVEGKRVSVRVDLGGRRIIKKKT